MKKLFALMMGVLFGLTCYAQSNRVVYALSPKMNCENCAARVQQAIRALTGVDSVKTCLGAQTVEVLYNATSLKPEVIVDALAGIGYTATPTEKKCSRTDGQCEKEREAAAAGKLQRIEQANPGIVTAIDGKATVREGQCDGKSCNEPGHQCTEQAVPAVKVNQHKAVKAGSASATATTTCTKEAACDGHEVAVPAKAAKAVKKDAKPLRKGN